MVSKTDCQEARETVSLASGTDWAWAESSWEAQFYMRIVGYSWSH